MKTSTCSGCGEGLADGDFSPRIVRVGRCRKCRADEARHAWIAANPEKNRKSKGQWNSRNKSAKAAMNRAWHVANRESAQAKTKDWKKRNPEAMFKHSLKKYGLTPEKYRALFVQQSGSCAICKKPPTGRRGLCVDHNHDTGVVRALLCTKCNAGLGNFAEETRFLLAAIDYLIAHGSPGLLDDIAAAH